MRLIALLVCCSIVGCSSVIAPTQSVLRGSLQGKLYVETLTSEIPSYGGERIIALGNDSIYRTTCDSTGMWKFDGLASGTYTLTFERDGFSTARITGFEFVGGGTISIPPMALYKQYDAPILDSVVEKVSSDGYFGNAFFVHASMAGLTLCFDRDSSILADRISDAAFCDWEGYSNQNEFSVPIIWNQELRRDATPITAGDYFYVAFGSYAPAEYLRPIAPLTSGHFSFMPFKQPLKIVRLQYNGKR